MPHFAERMHSPATGQRVSPSAAPQPRRTGPQRSALWHALQLKAAREATPVAAVPSRSGLPASLKAGVEGLSGIAMDDVRVHRNSPEPARLGALAYAQGNHIHLGPGQERHLPHEAWHVVQQKQGRVRATAQYKGVAVNEDGGLEREAEVMGARALAAPRGAPTHAPSPADGSASPEQAVQRVKVNGAAVAAEISAETNTKHVVATNDQAQAAKDNYGSTTFVTSAADITGAINAINYNFTQRPSTYKNFYRNMTVSVYSKVDEEAAGKPVTRTVNAASTRCQIGVQKTRNTGRIIVTHFKAA